MALWTEQEVQVKSSKKHFKVMYHGRKGAPLFYDVLIQDVDKPK